MNHILQYEMQNTERCIRNKFRVRIRFICFFANNNIKMALPTNYYTVFVNISTCKHAYFQYFCASFEKSLI